MAYWCWHDSKAIVRTLAPCPEGGRNHNYNIKWLQEWVPEDTHISISQRRRSLCYVLKHFSVLVNPRHNTTLYQISIPQMPAITRSIHHTYVKELCSTFHSTVFSIHFLCMWEFPLIPSTLVVGCRRWWWDWTPQSHTDCRDTANPLHSVCTPMRNHYVKTLDVCVYSIRICTIIE